MKFVLLLLFLGLALGIPKAIVRWRRMASHERAVFVRMTLFTATVALLFAMMLALVPENPRALLVIPMILAAVAVVKIWKAALARMRRNAEDRVDLERMKRVH
jgi:Kef-type K+ transport system membrane component KefB